MKRFNTKALFDALEEQRLKRGTSWNEISKEIGVSVSTMKRTKLGGRMEVDGMIAMVGWLGVKVEVFVRETDY